MLRFRILASAVPLMIAAVFARGGLLPGPHPCIAVGETSLQIASVPWRADLHVSFTDDPAFATVRVQISDSAEAADFAVVDDVDTAEDCQMLRGHIAAMRAAGMEPQVPHVEGLLAGRGW